MRKSAGTKLASISNAVILRERFCIRAGHFVSPANQCLHTRALGMLKNPSYAGMYVFGRYQYRREISPDGEIRKRMQAVAMPAWRVSLKEHHQGYISWEEFLENAKRLEKNRANGEGMLLSGPAREGSALLQGLLLCGNCGRPLTVRYSGNRGIYPIYLCSWLRREGLTTKDCTIFRCDLLDAAVSEQVLKALQPAELELALAALRELESRDQAIMHQWRMRLERAEYEVALAERCYQEVVLPIALWQAHWSAAGMMRWFI
jgi:Recombinase zinc beta ribbon domain/Recombinase